MYSYHEYKKGLSNRDLMLTALFSTIYVVYSYTSSVTVSGVTHVQSSQDQSFTAFSDSNHFTVFSPMSKLTLLRTFFAPSVPRADCRVVIMRFVSVLDFRIIVLFNSDQNPTGRLFNLYVQRLIQKPFKQFIEPARQVERIISSTPPSR